MYVDDTIRCHAQKFAGGQPAWTHTVRHPPYGELTFTAPLPNATALDDADGFILTGPDLGPGITQAEPWRSLGRGPFLVESSRPGVFAIGDVRSGSTRMVAPAAGDGGMAVRFVGAHLAQIAAR